MATILCFALVSLTGCAALKSEIPDLTEQEQGMVVEYATEVLLHYDRMNGDKIKPVKYSIVEDGTTVSEEEYGNMLQEETEASSGLQLPENNYTSADQVQDVTVVDNTSEDQTVVSAFSSLVECFGLSGISIEPVGYEITDFYPQSPTEYFVMNATDGNRLIILRFKLSNTSGSDMKVEIPYGDVKYKIMLNGNTKNALTTLLVNDLGTYSRDLLADENEEVVLVGEFPSSEADNISSLSVEVKREAGSYSVIFK
ncbi:MAG: hypothetical protein K5888_04375 [Lachnospiraceae bacterium]|nr:hypothetical protein [Lachnospiraceae bacterium]